MSKSVEKPASTTSDESSLPAPATLTPEELDGVVGGRIAAGGTSAGTIVKGGGATTGILANPRPNTGILGDVKSTS